MAPRGAQLIGSYRYTGCLIDFFASSMLRILRAIAALLAGIIEADNLATAEGIAESRRTLARYRMHVKRFQANMATIAQTYRELLGEQEGKELVKPLQDGLATITGLHQATLDTLTQVLDFADSRKGQLTVADGKLILQDEADLPILQSMFAKLRAAGVGARALNAQTR